MFCPDVDVTMFDPDVVVTTIGPDVDVALTRCGCYDDWSDVDDTESEKYTVFI